VAFTWVDWAIIAVIAISSLISLRRGFFKEALSLLTWIVAGVVAWMFGGALSQHLDGFIDTPSMRVIAACAALAAAEPIGTSRTPRGRSGAPSAPPGVAPDHAAASSFTARYAETTPASSQPNRTEISSGGCSPPWHATASAASASPCTITRRAHSAAARSAARSVAWPTIVAGSPWTSTRSVAPVSRTSATGSPACAAAERAYWLIHAAASVGRFPAISSSTVAPRDGAPSSPPP